MARASLLSLVHKGLDTGFNCLLHLLHHLFRIEGSLDPVCVDGGAIGVGGSDA